MNHALFRAKNDLTDRLQRLQWAVEDYQEQAARVRKMGGTPGHVTGLKALRKKITDLINAAEKEAEHAT